MSGIGGIVNPDGRPVFESDLGAMMSALAHRGPDGAAVWHEGHAGLGCRALHATPESALKAPQHGLTRDGECILSADVRLDNRDELLAALAPGQRAESVTDEELLLAAYRKWREGCAEHLIGDFAFAIWDRRRQELFCARDHFGIRPFYFHFAEGRTFVFGSEIKALLALDFVPQTINETRVADYLAGIVFDKESTFYRYIYRLPPGHTLRVGRTGLRKASYWHLERRQEIRLRDNNEYAEAFRETLSMAVKSRLRSSSQVGSLLSGGLDSTTITALAARYAAANGHAPIHTFSTVFDELHDCDERYYIQQLLEQDSYDSEFIHGDRCDHIGHLQSLIDMCDGPFLGPNAAMRVNQFERIRSKGIKVIIEGSGGDETVSHGYGYVEELAVENRWFRLARELHGLAQLHGDSFFKWYWLLVIKHGLRPVWSQSLIRRAYRRALRSRNGSSETERSSLVSRFGPLVDAEFARRMQLSDRYRAWRKSLPESAQTERERHHSVLTGALQPAAFEVLDVTAAAFSIENRLPFWDKRLVEFSYRLPPEQKLHGGWGRIVMRRAVESLMPSDVVWRKSKTNFMSSLQKALVADSRAAMQQIVDRTEYVEPYVDVKAFHDAYRRILSQDEQCEPRDVFSVWTVAGLSLWLQGRSQGQESSTGVPDRFWITPIESKLE